MYDALLIEWCILDYLIRVVFIPQVINSILCKLQPQFYPKLEVVRRNILQVTTILNFKKEIMK
jgi:hypothetical protein